MSGKGAVRPVLPCDFCKDPVAPFGHAPAPHLGIQIRRPIKTCAAADCKAKAAARVADLIERHDPLARSRRDRAAGGAGAPAQGSLFGPTA